MKQIWEDDFNNLYKDVEDMQNHYKYLESENNQLQSNWNSLREYAEELYNKEGSWAVCGARYVLDKMSELERKDKE